MGLLTSLLLMVFMVGSCTPQNPEVIFELSLKSLIDGQIKIIQKLDEQEKKMATQQTMIRGLETKLILIESQVEEVQNCATRSQVDAFKTTFVTESQKIMENNVGHIEEVKNSLQRCSTTEQIVTFQDLLDADECQEDSHNCSASATCTDTILSFKCSCKPGFSGDGFTCQDVDECRESTNVCRDEQLCTNLPGNYSCSCNEGYKTEGETCLDINECQTGVHDCHENATCTNNAGNYTCECLPYFDGDGYTCNRAACRPPSQYIPDLGCVSPVKEKMTWENAKENCHTKGQTLLEGIRREHLQPLQQHFKEYLKTHTQDAVSWMGLRGGVWMKSREPPVAQDNLWWEGYPKYDCGVIDLTHHSPYLFDILCSESLYVSLCQLNY